MQIQCECGAFKAELTKFPKDTPGRLACYCDDCQIFVHHLGRADVLDAGGGTEIVPVYPSDVKIVAGREQLKSTKLTPNGLIRWSTTCCNSPIANTKPGFPWAGFSHRVFAAKDPQALERTFGPVKSAIYGKYARGPKLPITSDKMTFKDATSVLPFILKGVLLRKAKPSPFFESDGVTPIVAPTVLAQSEHDAITKKLW